MQEMINKQYLGGEKEKKKVKKPSEKFRFNFDWEATDDTSRDLNPLYQDPQVALLLFGRGMRAGVDRREQKKTSAAHENELLRKMREAQVRSTLGNTQQHLPARSLVVAVLLSIGFHNQYVNAITMGCLRPGQYQLCGTLHRT